MSTISIVTPTIGRPTLKRLLLAALPEMSPGDELLVIGDGPQAEARRQVEEVGSPLVRYWEHGPIWNYGNPQRNIAISEAWGDYLVFLDDDDELLQSGITSIKEASREYFGRPLMFKMNHRGLILPRWGNCVVEGNISGQMFVPPNDKAKLGSWSGRYEADFDFITSTLRRYPGGEADVVWVDKLTVIQGYAGRGHIGKEIL